MQLPKELTTVTPLSKAVALLLFITLPIIGFLNGMQYQKTADNQPSSLQLSTPTPLQNIEIKGKYEVITDPVILNNTIVVESKNILINSGFSEEYFNKHFSLIRYHKGKYNEAGANVIEWLFTVGEYQTTILDSLGGSIDENGYYTNIVHSLPSGNKIYHDLNNVISKAKAEEIAQKCLSNYKELEVRLEPPGLFLVAIGEQQCFGNSDRPCITESAYINLESGTCVIKS